MAYNNLPYNPQAHEVHILLGRNPFIQITADCPGDSRSVVRKADSGGISLHIRLHGQAAPFFIVPDGIAQNIVKSPKEQIFVPRCPNAAKGRRYLNCDGICRLIFHGI